MGRKKLYSDDEIIAALTKSAGLVYIAAKKVGCSADTIYARSKSVPRVADCIKSQRGEFVDITEQSLRKAVKKGESWAVSLVLKTLGKDRGYGDKEPDKPPEGGSASGVPVELVTRLFALLGARQPDAGGTESTPVVGPVASESGSAIESVSQPGG